MIETRLKSYNELRQKEQETIRNYQTREERISGPVDKVRAYSERKLETYKRL